MINEDGLVHKNRFMLFPWISLRQSGLYLYFRYDLITNFQSISPTLEGKVLASSFGALEIFRVPQNTTCHVRLNMNFSVEKSKYGILSTFRL